MENTILFCANCTWEIIPMLLGAWLLGTAFWWLLKGNAMSSRITELTASEAVYKKKSTDLQLDLDTKGYELGKLETEHGDLRRKFDTMELQWRAAQEQIQNLTKDD